jgi:hypothetical protein
MQSTKGRAKHFIVLSRVDETGNLFEIQRFEYQEGDKFLTRKAAKRHAETARMRWQSNYWKYRDATMILTDTQDIEPQAPKLTRKQYARLQDAGVAPLDNSRASIAPAFVATRGQYDGRR